MDPKVLESWLRLTADALKGVGEARTAMEALTRTPLSPEDLSRWWAMWMPKAAAVDQTELQRTVEDWWRTIGVVPRQRYLELVEKYEELKARLEEAERTVSHLRELLKSRGREKEAGAALDSWEEVTRKALETQDEWMRTWIDGLGKVKNDEKKS